MSIVQAQSNVRTDPLVSHKYHYFNGGRGGSRTFPMILVFKYVTRCIKMDMLVVLLQIELLIPV